MAKFKEGPFYDEELSEVMEMKREQELATLATEYNRGHAAANNLDGGDLIRETAETLGEMALQVQELNRILSQKGVNVSLGFTEPEPGTKEASFHRAPSWATLYFQFSNSPSLEGFSVDLNIDEGISIYFNEGQEAKRKRDRETEYSRLLIQRDFDKQQEK